MAEPAAQVDAPSDFGTDEAATVSRWISELELAEKNQQPWVKRCQQIIKRYEDERTDSNDVKKRRYALLWSNIQTLGPACYARTPTAVVSRRWKDQDDVARVASEVLERALNFSLDAQDFADVMVSIRDEYLLVARSQAWVRYVPHIAKAPSKPTEAPDGETTDNDQSEYDEVIWEEVLFDHVHWEDFGTNPARSWAEVRFVWRRVFLTRDELVDRFGQKGKECPLDWKANAETGNDQDKDTQFAKAAVYEIWDRLSRKVYWVCKACTQYCLDERDDPLQLKDFFPCPRPLLGTCSPNNIIPTPDYVYYESQAQEINELTVRIGLLTDALKVRGYYAGAENQKLTDLLAAETNTLIPIDSWAAIAERGGIKGLVDWFPIDMVETTLKGCIEVRKQMLDDVFQITGIADIMRGDTDPDETLGAQQLKANWGSSRVRDKQKELARFARDLLRIMGEVIAKRFSTETLSKMTGVELMQDPQAKQLAVQQIRMQAASAAPAQQPQMGAPGQPAPPAAPPQPQIPPKLQRMLNDPTWADVEHLLRDNASRSFRIEVETDSTIEPNDAEEKKRRVEFVEAVGAYLEKTLTVVSMAPEILPVVIEGLKFLVRGFRVGREMEDVIDSAMDALQQRASKAQPQQPQKGPNPQAEMMKAQAAQTGAQAKIMDAHTDVFRAQTDRMEAQAGAQIENKRIGVEQQDAHLDRQSDFAQHAQDLAADVQKAGREALLRKFSTDVRSDHLLPPEPRQ